MIWGCGTDLTKSRVHYLGYSLDNEAYMFEVDKQGLDDRVIFVEKDDLDKKMVTE